MKKIFLGALLFSLGVASIASAASYSTSSSVKSGGITVVNSVGANVRNTGSSAYKLVFDVGTAHNRLSKYMKEVQTLYISARDDYESAMMISDAKERNAKLKTVINHLRKAMARDGLNSKLNIFASQVYAEMGDYVSAKICFDTAIDLLKRNGNMGVTVAYFDIAVAYYASDDKVIAGTVIDEKTLSEYLDAYINTYQEQIATDSQKMFSLLGYKLCKNIILHNKVESDKYYHELIGNEFYKNKLNGRIQDIVSAYPELSNGNFKWIKNDVDKAEKEFLQSYFRCSAY